MRRLEHVEVLHHTESGHLGETGAQCPHGLAVALEQCIEHRATSGVGQGPEDGVHIREHM